MECLYMRKAATSAIKSLQQLQQNMYSTGGLSLFTLHRCKTIHLVRHAQGIHNIEGEKDHSAYLSDELFDAHLTPLGWQQVDNLRKHVHTCGISKKVELVVTSPLLSRYLGNT
ncbi:Phosphoglycerate mutase-like protein 2 [Camellia lanceoleosa]|uniref:Phosphoglycerate mutase-like protein 2 n=1 Tax=Camellia lanceoleosa TaxID=1840588 RepID=A0ACC0GG06_9ERIC|nr:Phosphoglycerate mutase-like protein 2 [Camellia lanceoleosa]